jgi:hypothetical protein
MAKSSPRLATTSVASGLASLMAMSTRPVESVCGRAISNLFDQTTSGQSATGARLGRLNALRHGLRARSVVLPGEDRNEFNQLCDDLEVEWTPQSRTEQFYVEQMAVSQWKLIRMEIGEAAIFGDVEGAKTQLPLLDRFWQAECRLERSYSRAQRELERLQKSRRNPAQQPEEPPPAPAAEAPSAEVGQAAPAADSLRFK